MIFSNQLIEAIGWTVVHSLWQGAIIAFLLWIIFSVIKKKKASTRYLVANFALFTQIIVSIFTFKNFFQAENEIISSAAAVGTNIQNAIVNKSSIVDTITYFFAQHMDTIVLLWIVGAILFSVRMLMGYSYIFYLRNRYLSPVNKAVIKKVKAISNQLNITKKIPVHESALIQSPLVTGWIKPMILFPIGLINQLNTSEIEAIIAHELAHVSRHDILFNFVQSLSEIIYYYHPGIWWISNQIRKEREHSCDDIALQLTGNQINYAKALLQVQTYAQTPQFALGFSGKKGQLLTRVQRVLSPTETKTRLFEKMILSIVILGALFTMSFKEHQETKLDSFLDDFSTTITVKSEKNETYSIEVDSLPNGKNMLHILENNQEFEVEIEDGAIKNLLVDGKVISKNQYPKFKPTVDRFWNNDEDSIKVFVVDKDTIIMNGEDIVVVQNDNQPMITIKKNKETSKESIYTISQSIENVENDVIQIVVGDEKFNVLQADKDQFTAFKIEKVIEDNQPKWEEKSVVITSTWNIQDTSKSYFVDQIYETDEAWIFQSIENGSIREIMKSATPKVIVKTVNTDGAITSKVMLFNKNGNHQSTYFSVNEIGNIEIQGSLIDINQAKINIEQKKAEIEKLIEEMHLKTIH